jgi:hypothetical protein
MHRERNAQRKIQNLEIARKVANGELRPLVVSINSRCALSYPYMSGSSMRS